MNRPPSLLLSNYSERSAEFRILFFHDLKTGYVGEPTKKAWPESHASLTESDLSLAYKHLVFYIDTIYLLRCRGE
jgi:hypothetical protein